MNKSLQLSIVAGMMRGLPIVLGYLPVGFAFGVLAVKNNIPPAFIIAMAVLMFSGSGQFVFAGMWGHGVSILAVSVAVTIINLRYVLMSIAEAPWVVNLGRMKRFMLGLGITDETFVVHATALQKGWKLDLATMLSCNFFTQSSWVGGCAIGAFLGSLVSDVKPLGLDYAITAMFLALLMPQCVSRTHLLVALFSLCLSIALNVCGMTQWNIAVATICGASLGLALSLGKSSGTSENKTETNG